MISTKQPVRRRHPARQSHSWKSRFKPEVEGADEYGSVGWQPEQTVTVTELMPNMPAAKAGIQLNDQIVAINGMPMRSRVLRHPLPAAERRQAGRRDRRPQRPARCTSP